MKMYIEKLNAYLDSRPMKLEGADFDSVLDFLYNTYVEYHPIDTKEIQKQWQSIESILESLSIDDSNRVFLTMCSICDGYQEAAFREGLFLGARVERDLMENHN